VKIHAHVEQQRRKAETSPSGGAAAGVTALATILIKSVRQKGALLRLYHRTHGKGALEVLLCFQRHPKGLLVQIIRARRGI
jgi:hypothetical protein